MVSFEFLTTSSLLFVISTLLLEKFTNSPSYKPHAIIPKIQKLNNLFYSLFSLVMFFFGVLEASNNGILTTRKSSILQIFFYSKFYEFIDVFLVILNKSPVNLHFRFHHSTTPSLAWICIHGGNFIYLPLLLVNTLLHFFLYLFFSGYWKNILTLRILGFSQLLIGIIFSTFSLIRALQLGSIFFNELYGLFLFLCYLGLYIREIKDEKK
jgi:hypothetical protein